MYRRLDTSDQCVTLSPCSNLLALSRLDIVNSMAPQFTMRLRDRRVQVAFPVRLTCQIVGIPRPEVSWFKDEEPMTADGGFVVLVEALCCMLLM